MYQVQIPARDYDIDCSELEITCRYPNSRAPGGSCAAYDIRACLETVQHNATRLLICSWRHLSEHTLI